ncbi:acetyl-CoA C-acetyltransferase [Deinococcus radiodurans]|jgi:acetyl-CoA acetyltransferase (EC 2.3.1.9)|uniref:Acetyl-CoA acetyltransferase n=1 Tax=Deinococcus radiodurans (strain ATCC 13939 / DSM 20539 / JCM 16871 / CCUG 27074 / LMG 4051 / NBRC 15346 / NCIMB 9279 / VKM B-1422 / R1) TaxID=243230 RepID=Q9RT09_DEIRA|nr:acetyl-CoA C-acetyltransferase [Deinococcus radiodurans]AAF11511.1 acetyl-CoA acetyltransferase [Deinococcus radiodurans R1 = ATCC 13939 = DSM 20539]ANC70962.1 acetyl-CoA acetyltransferase [Deinococcus radiodurans R1 = ATCC 13939 = DSM 20539]QEM71359.1 acetyl-CoA C-acetyltransferase [Deinococcus radiodurans]QIP29897.1 acetyl-CoA C-acetyltransferase [Deinococcus radiodurans]QIP31427.1 acetyl-CoA C-acetyltransferase [Deinococcus radiodurans]
MSEKIVIVAAKRTPIGSFMGSLKDVSAVDLGVTAAGAVLSGVSDEVKADIADVIVGCVLQAGQGMNVARQVGRGAGLPDAVPGQTINRMCGSGLQSVVSAIQGLKSGDGQIYLAGGTESMSRAPYLLPKAREGYRLGHGEILDTILTDGLTDVFHNYHMGTTAENLAEKYGISREDQDAFALESQKRAAAAIEGGYFGDEVVPVEVPTRKGPVTFDKDEHPRATSLEALAKLRPAFKKDGGTVTAGNASGINDGAAMVLVTTESYAQERGLPILAEVKGYSNVGVDPAIMGIGPAYAVPLAVKRAGLSMSDVDLFELNEAFAAQSLAVLRDLGQQGAEVDPAHVNLTGGAIALGHPIGASGARVLTTLIHQLRRTGKETGVASLCIGGGMGIALVLQAR